MHTAKVDVDWAGENVTVSLEEGSINVFAHVTPEAAKRMIHQLEWAIGEVVRFAEHMELDGEAGRFTGKAKP